MPADVVQPAAISRRYLVLVTIVTIVPAFMTAIDGTITNLGFGTIAGGLNVSIDEVAWISTAYLLGVIVAMPLSGWLAANLGRRTAFLASLALFTAASFACALSGTLVQLALARFVQGLAAGAMQPLASAALIDAYPREQMARAFKIFGFGAMIGPLLGPTLGGVMLANFPWPAIFLINVPIGIAALWLAWPVLRNQSEAQPKSAFDWNALLLMAVGLFAFQYVIQQGPRDDWFASRGVLAAALVAALALGLFVRMQVRAPQPLVDFHPLRTPSFAIGVGIAVVTGIGLTGTSFIVPLYFQQVLRFDPTTAGLGVLPAAAAMFVGLQLAEMLNRRLTPVGVMLLSLAITALSTLWFCFLGKNVGFSDIVLPRIVQGLGFGMLYLPLNMIMMAHVPKRWYDAASGLGGLSRQLGVSFGYALLSALVVHSQTAAANEFFARVRMNALTDAIGLAPIRTWLIAHGYNAADVASYSIAVFEELVARDAQVLGYNQTFFVLGMLFVACMPVVAVFWRAVGRQGSAP